MFNDRNDIKNSTIESCILRKFIVTTAEFGRRKRYTSIERLYTTRLYTENDLM